MAVCQTAQLVQERVAKLVAARAQLESHRASLHHHLATVTNLLATTADNQSLNPNNVSVAATSANNGSYPVSSQINDPTVINGGPIIDSSAINGGPSLDNTCVTSVRSNLYGLNPSTTVDPGSMLSNRSPVYSTNGVFPDRDRPFPGAKASQSTTSSSSGAPWSGISASFLAGGNPVLPVESKDSIYHPYLIPKKEQKTTTPISLSKTSTKSVYSSHNSSKNPSVRHHGSSRGSKSPGSHSSSSTISNHGSGSSNKLNGPSHVYPQSSIYKPHQMNQSSSSICSPNKLINNKVSTISAFSAPPSVPLVGTSSRITDLQTSTSSDAISAQKGVNPSQSQNGSKNGRTSKPQIGFAPYAKTSPTKVQTWVPN